MEHGSRMVCPTCGAMFCPHCGTELVKDRTDALLARDISVLDLSVRPYNCLARAGVRTVGALVKMDEAQLLGIRNINEKSVAEIRDRLAEKGLCLAGEGQDAPGEV